MSEGSPTEAFGPYLVYEKLGVGGMAQVHRAVAANAPFPRPIALKRMLSHITDNAEMVKSFVREARLASYLRHENVAETYDLGKVGDTYFIVMELITGRNLREVFRHCGATTGPMPVPIALNILNQICDALDYAHNLCDETGEPLGIIHRDVSPSNVIVSDSGVVKLIDFGIAKASGAGMQTMGGALKGKFAYMAPEYIAGQIDARADLFALGVIAHELLTNRPLFCGRDDIDTLTRVRDMHIDPPSKKNPLVPPEIDDIVMIALARDPERRWQHATALRTALTTLTRRLDLVATNAQVVQWLDWAFGHAPAQSARAQTDTETDGEPLLDDDSNSLTGQHTVNLLLKSRKVPLALRDAPPAPPTKTPAGTPAYIPAQRSRAPLPTADDAEAAERTGRYVALAARGVTNTKTAAMRPSALHPVQGRSPATSPPPYAPGPYGTSSPAAQSLQPVMDLAIPSVRPAPSGFQVAPRPAAQSFRPVPEPMLPAFTAPPIATPRPSAQLPAVPRPYDSVRSAIVQREFVQRVSAPSLPAVTLARSRHTLAVAVILVVLAAAAAAITIYFVLPLLTSQ